MNQKENTKNEPEQVQSPELQESEQPKAEQSDKEFDQAVDAAEKRDQEKIKQMAAPEPEPARKCQICGSPNHHACGCEARARRENTGFSQQPKQSEPEMDLKMDRMLSPEIKMDRILSPEGIIEQHKALIEINTKVKEQAQESSEFFNGSLSSLRDVVEYLKVISDDVITIRTIFQKHDTQPETKDVPKTE